jgi:hypothetical protein
MSTRRDRRTRRALASAVAVAAASVALAACHDPAKSSLPAPAIPFCAAAQRYDEAIQKPSKATRQEQAAAQVPLVEKMAVAAPADVKRAAGIFLDAMRRRAAGDASVVDQPSVRRAVDDVNRRAGNGCGFYKSQSGGGGI